MDKPLHKKKHLLTVLVEDYFHVGAFGKLVQQQNWSNFEARYERNTIKALDLLDESDTKGTFFVLGWIARESPGLIREISSRGHEVASRGFYHRSIQGMSPDEFREEIRRAKGQLEDAACQEVIGYRAAEKLRFGKSSWIFDILSSEGFEYDASFVPSKADESRMHEAHLVSTNHDDVWELPYSTVNTGIGLLPISGGNYFRQIPYTLMRHAVSAWDRNREAPFTFYFHVWELDPEQPRISAASRFNRLRHYRKLDKMEWIIRENLDRYRFVRIAEYLGLEERLTAREEQPLAVPSGALRVDRFRQAAFEGSSVTIIIPCYNEAETLPYLAKTLDKVTILLSSKGYEVEFIFIDDCSTDSTYETLNRLFESKNDVRIVRHTENRGVAAGIMTGLRSSSNEVVCSMDCDCTYDPQELAAMIPLLGPDVDMVTASPYHPLGGVRNVPSWRLFLSRGASFLYRRTLRSKLSTYTSCFRVYRKSSFNRITLRESGFLGVAEMLGKLDLQGGTILEHPAVLDVRLFGISKMKTVRTMIGHLRLLSDLVKLRFFKKSRGIETAFPQGRGALPQKVTPKT